MSNADDALQRLYEDTSWREDLIDSEANALLQWAESKLIAPSAHAASESDAIDFAARVDEIRHIMRQIDKFVARRDHMPPDEQQLALDDMAAIMQVTPLTITDLDKRGFSAQAVRDHVPMINALTAWLDGGDLPLYTEPEAPIIAQAATPDPEPQVITDATSLSAILGFFNSALDETVTDAANQDENKNEVDG